MRGTTCIQKFLDNKLFRVNRVGHRVTNDADFKPYPEWLHARKYTYQLMAEEGALDIRLIRSQKKELVLSGSLDLSTVTTDYPTEE